jgi:hypothetical protein
VRRASAADVVDTITGAAAFVSDERLDIVATNQLGRALFLSGRI